jgi:hypothetical protein
MKSDEIISLMQAARAGHRLVHELQDTQKTLWPGLGNRAGLHSFAYELTEEKYRKGSERLRKKLTALTDGTIVVLMYRAKSRDTGRWVKVHRFSV